MYSAREIGFRKLVFKAELKLICGVELHIKLRMFGISILS